MYVLVVREADGNETEYDLDGEVILGRDESADIRLGDGSVSRKHARLFIEDGLCYLEDLGSSNGTTIGGQPVVGAVEDSVSTVAPICVTTWICHWKMRSPVHGAITERIRPKSRPRRLPRGLYRSPSGGRRRLPPA